MALFDVNYLIKIAFVIRVDLLLTLRQDESIPDRMTPVVAFCARSRSPPALASTSPNILCGPTPFVAGSSMNWPTLPVGFFLAIAAALPSLGYEIGGRWTETQRDGGGIERGDPITLLWSIVPDGESYERSSNSDLIDYLDDGWNVPAAARTPLLTSRPWWSVINSAYAQYNRVSGLRMAYVSELRADGSDSGREGDIRIGGELIDNNPGGVLADNTFPNGGDMRIDTSRDGNGVPSGVHTSAAPFRNLISHESGHGVGLGHSDLQGAESVMESFLQDHFFGLQFDDVYAFNRLYGDPLEKSGGNDSSSTATLLGAFSSPGVAIRGADAMDSVVEEEDDDWLGIDGTSDQDWFRFSTTKTAVVDLRVTPIGPSYTTTEQGAFNAAAQADLVMEIYSPEMMLLRSIDQAALGGAEGVNSLTLMQPGDYFVRVAGRQDNNQFYRIDLDVALPDLVLTVDRATGAASMRATSAVGVDLDGYSILSSSGGLLPSDGDWGSLADQGDPGWREANPTANRLSELLPSGLKHVGAAAVDLGRIYSPQVTEPFGTPHEEDLTFEFHQPGDQGEPLKAAVEFLGDPFANNLVLTVDPVTGLSELTNESFTTIALDGYSIFSSSQSLDPALWSSLDDQSASDWREANPTEGRLSELKPTDGTILSPSDSFRLGRLFQAGGSPDLALVFQLNGENRDWEGVVRYARIQLPGDYDIDGDIDSDDYVVWSDSFGDVANLLADGNQDGVVDAADYTVWRDAYTASSSAVTNSVPEPQTLGFVAMTLFCCSIICPSQRFATKGPGGGGFVFFKKSTVRCADPGP
jgi:hypothetical protein